MSQCKIYMQVSNFFVTKNAQRLSFVDLPLFKFILFSTFCYNLRFLCSPGFMQRQKCLHVYACAYSHIAVGRQREVVTKYTRNAPTTLRTPTTHTTAGWWRARRVLHCETISANRKVLILRSIGGAYINTLALYSERLVGKAVIHIFRYIV